MKFFATAVVFVIFAYLGCVSGKSLKDFHSNKLSVFKGQRKPLASPVVNGIHDNYTRSKRHVPKAITDFQDLLTKSKKECIRELRMNPTTMNKSLMYADNLTGKEKCLIACMLKRSGLMDNTNKLNGHSVAQLAGRATNNNALVMSIAMATANNCNNSFRATNACDAAAKINQCISREMKAHKLKLMY